MIQHNLSMENHMFFNEKVHYKWPCSIAMLTYQRIDTNMTNVFNHLFWESGNVWELGNSMGRIVDVE